eukprot:Phypoly_transcript_16187.p1 GENE.Phypoly_transcript_16187~~Phypoly_transcript_16187.p1  ORF type:complete len:269 (+),score=20.78 Phypoly_transcript_16187:60-866(+)
MASILCKRILPQVICTKASATIFSRTLSQHSKSATQPNGKKFIWFAIFPAISFGLGTWQLMRMQWKQKIIDKANAKMAEPPVKLAEEVCSKDFDWHNYEFQRVTLTGTFVQGLSMPVGPRTRDGVDGYQIVSPFKLENGCTVLVNRGWISKENWKKQWVELASPVTVVGYFRSPVETGSGFTPPNKPSQNTWFSIDSYTMADWVRAVPVLINAASESPDSPVKIAKFSPNAADVIFNRHFEYVLTWYSLSALLSGLTWYLVKHPPRVL